MRTLTPVLSVVIIFVASASLSLAGQPPGLEKKGKVPPGFSQGKKQGWDSVYPPGWDRKKANEKNKWRQAVQSGEKRISNYATEKGMSEQEIESAVNDFRKAVRKGLDPEETEALVRNNINNGRKGKSLSEALIQEIEKHLKQ